MPPVATTDPSPDTPSVPPAVAVPIVDQLHLWLVIVLLEDSVVLRLEFIEDAASGRWNAGHRVDRRNRAREGRRPCNAKHSCQK